MEEARWRELTLVASRTWDRVSLPNGGYRDLPGGPAHYIGTALEALGRPYRLFTGDIVRTEVVPRSQGQEYLIPHIPPIPLPPRLQGEAAILSPIMDEIDPASVPPTDGLLVVDVQGFLRSPNRPTDEFNEPADLWHLLERSNIVKATDKELGALGPRSALALERCMLLITRGQAGAIVRHGSNETHVPSTPVDAANTIGAGDIYLAAFVVGLTDGLSPLEAGLRAAKFTADDLKRR